MVTKNLQIVCGANNAKENLISVLAPVGSIIFSEKKMNLRLVKVK